MKKIFLLLAVFLLLSYSRGPVAQSVEEEPLNAVWAENDIKGVKFLIGLMPIENHTLASLKKQFDTETSYRYTSWSDEEVLGFGAKRVKLSMGLGYTTIYIDVLLFRNRIIHYDVGARVGAKEWPAHRQRVIQAWNEKGVPSVLQDSYNLELIYKRDFPDIWASYYSEVRTRLGPMRLLDIPASLRPSYSLLVDPFENSRISMVACDDGKPAIDALEDAKRVDLIENVLRGYNPGGRIYAAVSLLRMQRSGKKLSRATTNAIAKVVALDAETGTCWGHTGVNGLKARDIVPEYVKSPDWYLLRK